MATTQPIVAPTTIQTTLPIQQSPTSAFTAPVASSKNMPAAATTTTPVAATTAPALTATNKPTVNSSSEQKKATATGTPAPATVKPATTTVAPKVVASGAAATKPATSATTTTTPVIKKSASATTVKAGTTPTTSPAVPNTRISPLNAPAPEIKRAPTTTAATATTTTGANAKKVSPTATTTPVKKNTELAKLPSSLGTKTANSSPALKPASAKKVTESAIKVLSPRTEIALAHEIVRANRDELAAIEAAKLAEEKAAAEEWEKSRKAELQRIDAELIRIQKEKEEEEDRKTTLAMEQMLAKRGVVKEGPTKADQEAVAALRAAKAAEAEAAAQLLKVELKAERALKRKSGSANDMANMNEAVKKAGGGHHHTSSTVNSSSTHPPHHPPHHPPTHVSHASHGDLHPVPKGATHTAEESKESSAETTAKLPSLSASPNTTSQSRLAVKSTTQSTSSPNATRGSSPLPSGSPTHPPRSRSGSISKPPASSTTTATHASPKVPAGRRSPSISIPTNPPPTINPNAALESLALDPTFAALKDKNVDKDDDKEENELEKRHSRRSSSKKKRSSSGSVKDGEGGRRKSASSKDQAALFSHVPGFLDQLKSFDATIQQAEKATGTPIRSRTPVQDGSETPVPHTSGARTPSPKTVLEETENKSIEQHCDLPIFVEYQLKLKECRATLLAGVENGKVTGGKMHEALAFIHSNDVKSAHTQIVYQAGFLAGKRAAQLEALAEAQAAAEAAELVAKGMEKKPPTPKLDTATVISPQGKIIVALTASP